MKHSIALAALAACAVLAGCASNTSSERTARYQHYVSPEPAHAGPFVHAGNSGTFYTETRYPGYTYGTLYRPEPARGVYRPYTQRQ